MSQVCSKHEEIPSCITALTELHTAESTFRRGRVDDTVMVVQYATIVSVESSTSKRGAATPKPCSVLITRQPGAGRAVDFTDRYFNPHGKCICITHLGRHAKSMHVGIERHQSTESLTIGTRFADIDGTA